MSSPPASASKPLDDRWYRVLLNDQPAGESHTRVYRTDPGDIQTDVTMRLTIRRADTTMEIGMSNTTVETDDGEVLRLTTRQVMSKAERETTAVVQGDKLLVTSGNVPSARVFKQPFDIRARGPWWVDRTSRKELRKPGDSLVAVTVFPELQSCAELTLTLGEKESVEIDGERRQLFRRTTAMNLLPGQDQSEWVDESGVVQRGEFEIMGLKFALVLSSGKSTPTPTGSAPEVLLSTAIKPDRPLPAGNSIVYRFSLKENTFDALDLGNAFTASGHKILETPGPSVRVVRISRASPGKTVSLPVPARPELEAFLQPSSIVQSDHESIRTAAADACEGVTDAFDAARRLEQWVHDHIQEKNLETPFASALEAFESASGDCTEHGVLLAALARSGGIPARLVTGLVYHEGKFIGHLWTEVFIDRWIALDATRGHGFVGPDHIALATSSLSEAAFGDVVLQLARILGNLDIQIVN